MMNGEETDGGISLGDMEKALVCLLMTSMEAPVQAESAGLTQEMFADASLGFVYEVIMKIYATGVRPDMVLVERGMREADEELAAKLGGLSFLLPYMLNVRHDGNVAAYVEGIKKQYKLRCLVTLFGTMAFKAGKVSSVPEELVDEAERLLMQFRQKTAEGAPVRTIGELAAEAVSWHYRRFGGELEAEQVKSGLAEFDYVTGGFHNTELTIVAGRPSDGKTAVTLQMALNAARAGKSVCFFSLEMSSLQMLNRVLAGMTDVNPDHLRINKPTGRELGQLEEAALRLKDLPFYLDYTVGATVEQIRAKVLLQCRLGKCDLVVVDYLHLLGGDRRKGETQEQMVGRNVSNYIPVCTGTYWGDTGTDGGTECKGVEATGVGQQLSGADGFADESCLRGACRQGVPAGDERPARFGDDRAGGGLCGVHLPSRTLWLHPRRKDGA